MANIRMTVLLRVLGLSLATACLSFGATRYAHAASTIDFLASLSDSEIDSFRAWREARSAFNDQVDAYWEAVEAKRRERRKKRAARIPFDNNDYVMSFPPKYTGPKL